MHWTDYFIALGAGTKFRSIFYFLVFNQQIVFCELFIQAALHKVLIIIRTRLVYLPVNYIILFKNKARWIAKRTLMGFEFLGVHSFSEDLLVLSDFEKIFLNLWPRPLKTLRPKTPTPATTPIKDWNTTLPLLGSKYAKKLPKCKILLLCRLNLATNQLISIHYSALAANLLLIILIVIFTTLHARILPFVSESFVTILLQAELNLSVFSIYRTKERHKSFAIK
jgi:hypothetical protein